MLFFKEKKKPVHSKGSSVVADSLELIPKIADGVEALSDDQGLLQLRKPLNRKGALVKAVASLFRFVTFSRLDLDVVGSFYWRQINDSKTLATIEKAMAKEFRFEHKQCTEAVVLFTKKLLVRKYITLRLSSKAGNA